MSKSHKRDWCSSQKEAYKNQIIPLREEEKELKAGIRKLELSLVEKERSEEHRKLLSNVVSHFATI